jgi:FixJ family two-component response regulator
MSKHRGVAIIVDDDADVRGSLASLLTAANFRTMTHASGAALLKAGLPTQPTCLILDLQLPGEDGIHIQRQLRERDPQLPIIFLSGQADVPSAVAALKDGAVDFLEKGGFEPEALIQWVGDAIEQHRTQLKQRARIQGLSHRERQVAYMVAQGKANKVIAAELGISNRTVEIHRGNAMHKLDLRSVTDLARLTSELSGHPE